MAAFSESGSLYLNSTTKYGTEYAHTVHTRFRRRSRSTSTATRSDTTQSSDSSLSSTSSGASLINFQLAALALGRNGAAPPLNNVPPPWHTGMLSSRSSTAYNYHLSCDFELCGCGVRFAAMDWQNWISHSLSHFAGTKPPITTVCTHCNYSFPMQVSTSRQSRVRVIQMPEDNWWERMIHIGGHFAVDPTFRPIPNAKFLYYLKDNNLISLEDFSWNLREVPKSNLVKDQKNTVVDNRRYDGLDTPGSREKNSAEAESRRSMRHYSVANKKMSQARKTATETHNAAECRRREASTFIKFVSNVPPKGSDQAGKDSAMLTSTSSFGGCIYGSSLSMLSDSEDQDDETYTEDTDVEDDAILADLQRQIGSILNFCILSAENRTAIVQKYMAKYNSFFESEAAHFRGHGSPRSSETTSGVQSSVLTNSSNKRKAKHPRNTKERDDRNDDANGNSKAPEGDEDPSTLSEPGHVFACPFRKRNPQKYSIQEWRNCALTGHSSISRVKGHIDRYHMIYQCPRCKMQLPDENELEQHGLNIEGCPVNPPEIMDGVTLKMRDLLKCRKRAYAGHTPTEKWQRMYRILFPGEIVPNPYFEPVTDIDIQGLCDLEIIIGQEKRRRFVRILNGLSIDNELHIRILAAYDESQGDVTTSNHIIDNTNSADKFIINSTNNGQSFVPAQLYPSAIDSHSHNRGFSVNRLDHQQNSGADSGYMSNSARPTDAVIQSIRADSQTASYQVHIGNGGPVNDINQELRLVAATAHIGLGGDSTGSLSEILENSTSFDEFIHDAEFDLGSTGGWIEQLF